MLDTFIALTQSYEFEEYGTLDLIGVRSYTDSLTLSFDLNIRSDSEDNQKWAVDCVGLLEHQIYLGECNDFILSHDHPLLWPYIFPEASVSFYGEAEDPLA